MNSVGGIGFVNDYCLVRNVVRVTIDSDTVCTCDIVVVSSAIKSLSAMYNKLHTHETRRDKCRIEVTVGVGVSNSLVFFVT